MSGRLYADLTQSWSEKGGGVRTYLNRKRRYILEQTRDQHLLIIPGPEDSVVEEPRAITVTIRSPRVPGSPNYRMMLRNGAVRAALDRFRPDLIECQDAYNLPWAALQYRGRNPQTALVASFMTDFPNAYIRRAGERIGGRWLGELGARGGYRYCANLYRRFDRMIALSEHGGADTLRSIGVRRISVVPLGVDIDEIAGGARVESLRALAGAADGQPLLVYVGRLDHEKRAAKVVEAFQRLPQELDARLVLIGAGPLLEQFERVPGVYATGFIDDAGLLARWLASADVYVSGMADETFGISVIEAQAAGLPVVGVAAGAMLDRVPPALGRLGPVDDEAAMAANIVAVVTDPGRAEMAAAARAHAASYSWDAAMTILFEQAYPAAFERRAAASVKARALRQPAVAALANDDGL